MDSSQDKITVYIDADLEDLIPGFLENRQSDIQAINQALQEENYESVQVIGHGMKGAGGGYGFEEISEIGDMLEQAAKNEENRTIRILADELAAYLEKVEIKYEE